MFKPGTLCRLLTNTPVWVSREAVNTGRYIEHWLSIGSFVNILEIDANFSTIHTSLGVFVTVSYWINATQVEEVTCC